jgi:hypothetical protein
MTNGVYRIRGDPAVIRAVAVPHTARKEKGSAAIALAYPRARRFHLSRAGK